MSQFFSEGLAAFVDEEYAIALDKFTLAIKEDASNADYLVKRAAVYIQLGSFAEALEDSNRALEPEPNSEKAFLRKGSVPAFLQCLPPLRASNACCQCLTPILFYPLCTARSYSPLFYNVQKKPVFHC